jgi:PIN domain nuclease of toxin-antitoxin system
LLLDTHVVLWALEADPHLSDDFVRALSAVPRPRLIVSTASLWEIAIKMGKGKLRAPAELPSLLERDGFEIMSVTAEHAWAVRNLPTAFAHKDPFDRLIYAQARVEGLTLATRDAVLLESGLDVIRV